MGLGELERRVTGVLDELLAARPRETRDLRLARMRGLDVGAAAAPLKERHRYLHLELLLG